MKTRQQIKDRLSELNEKYRMSSDMYNPVLQARIKELNWVIEDGGIQSSSKDTFISHDG